MNANDARLTAVYPAHTGSTVADDAPNAPGPAGNFDLVLEAVAGNAIGNSGGPYTLTATAIDDTAQAPVAVLSIPPTPQAFNGATGWAASGPDFENTQVFNFAIPPGLSGHVLHYVASIVNQNAQVVSILESEKFILV